MKMIIIFLIDKKGPKTQNAETHIFSPCFCSFLEIATEKTSFTFPLGNWNIKIVK